MSERAIDERKTLSNGAPGVAAKGHQEQVTMRGGIGSGRCRLARSIMFSPVTASHDAYAADPTGGRVSYPRADNPTDGDVMATLRPASRASGAERDVIHTGPVSTSRCTCKCTGDLVQGGF
jgi:hypothetical protein